MMMGVGGKVGSGGGFLADVRAERERREAWKRCGEGLSGGSVAMPLPGAAHPRAFLASHMSGDSGMEPVHGTTTLAFVYEGKGEKDLGGLFVAADSRASTGTYTASKTVEKILDVSPTIVATMAGGAADCQYWMGWLAKEVALEELRNDGDRVTVAQASKILANQLYFMKGYGLSIGSMVAGLDRSGPTIFYVDNNGQRAEGKKFSVGSGSLNAVSVLDHFYKPVMTDLEAEELATKAICEATYRDAGSGGLVNVVHISKAKGKNRYQRRDVLTAPQDYKK